MVVCVAVRWWDSACACASRVGLMQMQVESLDSEETATDSDVPDLCWSSHSDADYVPDLLVSDTSDGDDCCTLGKKATQGGFKGAPKKKLLSDFERGAYDREVWEATKDKDDADLVHLFHTPTKTPYKGVPRTHVNKFMRHMEPSALANALIGTRRNCRCHRKCTREWTLPQVQSAPEALLRQPCEQAATEFLARKLQSQGVPVAEDTDDEEAVTTSSPDRALAGCSTRSRRAHPRRSSALPSSAHCTASV